MPESREYPDAMAPLDGLRHVLEAIASGASDLEPEALHAVSRLGSREHSAAREQFNQLESPERFAAADRLRQAAVSFAGYDFTNLFALLLTDGDASVRTVAVHGLSVSETAEATSLMLAAAQSQEEETSVRMEAVTALGAVALRLEIGWASDERTLGVVPALRALAEDALEDEQLRAAAIASVAVMSEAWVAGLIEDAFDSDDAALHLGAVQAMGRNADESWLSWLEGSLYAEDEDERLAAAMAIGEIGSEEGAPLLLDLFDDATANEELLAAAVGALGEIGSEEALEQLEQLRTHPDPALRSAAQDALSQAAEADDFSDFEPPLDSIDEADPSDPLID